LVRVGWIPDSHVGEAPGIGARLTEMVVDLVEVRGCSRVFLGGDNTWGWDAIPHRMKPENVDAFWSLVRDSGYLESCHAIPGNHDTCLWVWRWRSPKRYSGFPHEVRLNGLTCLLLSTVGPGWEPAGDEYYDMQAARSWIPYRDLLWLERALREAVVDRGDVVLVFHHHPTYNLGVAGAAFTDGNYEEENLYWVAINWRKIHSTLAARAPLVTLCGHIWPDADGYVTADSVYYVYKRHTYDAAADAVTTYQYVDVDPATRTVRVVSVDYATKAETTILEATLAT